MVSVYDVYNTVQVIINKENRGYLTKDEFNRLAIQAQLEIFEAYFGDKNRANALGENSDDYSDIARNVDEKINFFNELEDKAYVPGDPTGFFRYPDNFYRLGVVSVPQTNGLSVVADQVSHKDIRYIQLSNLTAPTVSQPVYVRRGGSTEDGIKVCLLYTSPSPRDATLSRMPSSA